MLTGVSVKDTAGSEAAARKLLDMGAKAVLMTLGERGALYVTREETTVRYSMFGWVINVVGVCVCEPPKDS
jgi:fructose-1-phosphate kinase PfkB-like protein